MTNKGLGPKIKELHEKGYNYPQIEHELQCSRGTICYHLCVGQKQKSMDRKQKFRNKQHPYYFKLVYFLDEEKIGKKSSISKTDYYILIHNKIKNFFNHRKTPKMRNKPTFKVQDVINKFGENPKCALTGVQLDIYDPTQYAFDHKIPRSRGGDNSIDNLQIVTKKANTSKSDLLDSEFVELCKQVVENAGYTISKCG